MKVFKVQRGSEFEQLSEIESPFQPPPNATISPIDDAASK
jgi:hypothetical protein